MKKSYNLIKAKNLASSYQHKDTYKKIDETNHCLNSLSLQKMDEPSRYGEKVWVKPQVENYLKWTLLSRHESFKSDESIDSGNYDSSTYSKSSTSLKSVNTPIRYFRSIWHTEEEFLKHNISSDMALKIG